MSTFSFWQRWLFVLSLFIIGFGLAMAFFNGSLLFGPLNRQVDPVFWGSQVPSQPALAFRGWVYGVLGSTMAGWGVFIAFIAHHPFRKRERWAWNCLALGMLVWYLSDTFVSITSGVVFNAVFNTMLLVLIALPLIFTRKEFR